MKTRSFISFVAVLLFSINSYSQDGASIYKKNCAACHTIGNGKIVGPDLKGVDKKYEMKWLLTWIKSSQEMIKKKDPVAVQLFNDNKQIVMPDQVITEEEVKSVIAYIGNETTKLEQVAAAPVAVPEASPALKAGSSQTTSDSSKFVTTKTIIYVLLGIIVFLTAMLISLGRVIKDMAQVQK